MPACDLLVQPAAAESGNAAAGSGNEGAASLLVVTSVISRAASLKRGDVPFCLSLAGDGPANRRAGVARASDGVLARSAPGGPVPRDAKPSTADDDSICLGIPPRTSGASWPSVSSF